mmetsp:Transcript_11960/g.22899  ORF Transcript_11960/g.22899 Transcript_11960/m.22899 type:complete len:92 (-) Transcript_11960:985-1260(-)
MDKWSKYIANYQSIFLVGQKMAPDQKAVDDDCRSAFSPLACRRPRAAVRDCKATAALLSLHSRDIKLKAIQRAAASMGLKSVLGIGENGSF